MKTNKVNSEIKKICLITLLVVVFTLAYVHKVETMNISRGSEPEIASVYEQPVVPPMSVTSTTPITEEPSFGSTLRGIQDNPDYWADYLRTKIAIEEKTEEIILPEASSITREMEQNPTYWSDYLNSQVENENSGNIIQRMENDPLYWKHYLDSITIDSI